MKRVFQVCMLLGVVLLVIAAYFHIYETSSTGMLPVIGYPLRPYALPTLIISVAILASGIVLELRRETK